MWWPEIPMRTKWRLLPRVALFLVLYFVAQEWLQVDTAPNAQAATSTKCSSDIPTRYCRLYHKAGGREVWRTRDGKRYPAWAVLAAVGKVESGHGANMGPSSAGALGPMQFMPRTWPGYGHGSVWNPANAIPAARKYLLTYRARRDLGWALAAYNAGPGRADNPPAVTRQYVRNALALARRYQKGRP